MEGITVFGTYTSRELLEAAIVVARSAGFRDTDVSILVPQGADAPKHEQTNPLEGSTAVLGSNIVLSGGGLGALGAGMVMVPSMGPMLAVGPILTALSRGQAEMTVANVTTWLIGMGIPAYQARRYEAILQRGGILASLHADNAAWVKKAKRVLESTGARQIFEADEAKGAFTQADRPKLRKAS